MEGTIIGKTALQRLLIKYYQFAIQKMYNTCLTAWIVHGKNVSYYSTGNVVHALYQQINNIKLSKIPTPSLKFYRMSWAFKKKTDKS